MSCLANKIPEHALITNNSRKNEPKHQFIVKKDCKSVETKTVFVMKRIAVNSSVLASIGYQTSKKLLEIEFNSGGIYDYLGVPRSEYEALMHAESHGRYFTSRIRNEYTYKRVK